MEIDLIDRFLTSPTASRRLGGNEEQDRFDELARRERKQNHAEDHAPDREERVNSTNPRDLGERDETDEK